MKNSDWKDCLENNSVRKRTPDRNRAKSLKETSKERLNLIKEINEKNCNFVFEDYYTSLLELLQAKAFEMGFNISNHLCTGYFIRDFLKKEKLYKIFDDLRYKRNSLTYYGYKMDLETSKKAIEDCKKLIKEFS